MEALLTAHLLASAGVMAIVGGVADGALTGQARISWNEVPQAEALPAVILHGIGTARSRTLRGRIGQTNSRVQVDCWAGSAEEAKALREAVLVSLDALTERPLQLADLNDDPPDRSDLVTGPDADRSTAMFAASLDVQLWHDPTA